MTGEFGSLEARESYESDRSRSGILGEGDSDVYEFERLIFCRSSSLELRGPYGMVLPGVGSSFRRDTCRPEESLACMAGRTEAISEI